MILVTGASGFIGARLTQRLSRERGEQVAALAHRLGTPGAARLAALRGIRLIQGDIANAAGLEQAMQGCGTVVHCAVDVSSAPSVQQETNAGATRGLIEAARRTGVKHVVFLSTAAVHSWNDQGAVTESAPLDGRDSYTRSKIDAETLLMGNVDVPVTVIRPTCVYGPFGRTFTVTPVTFLRLGIPLVPSHDPGQANLIYVDNLADMIFCALDRPPTAHRVYLANDREPVRWETLYAAYANTIGVPLERFAPVSSRLRLFGEEIAVSWSNARYLSHSAASGVKTPLLRRLATYHRHVPVLQRCDRLVPMNMLRRAMGAVPAAVANGAAANNAAASVGLRAFAPRELREFYNAKASVSAEKAHSELGWAPRVSASEAIERTCAWINFAGI